MADIAKIKLPGDTTEYNIKDATARSTFSSYLPLAGGTVTGDLGVNGKTTVKKLKATSGSSYMLASEFASNPPTGETGQVLFVIQGL